MKKLIDILRKQPAGSAWLIFLGMIIPSLCLFLAAENSSQPGMTLWLGLVVLANLAAVIPTKEK